MKSNRNRTEEISQYLMIEELGRIVATYLDNNSGWKRSQIDLYKNQGREVVWRNERHGWSIIRHENYFTSGIYSVHSPRHVWRIGGVLGKTPWSLQFSYGHAPYESETQTEETLKCL